MRAWMALSVAMSNSPRARPDWLVATTVCQPAWLRRAIASSEPGIGTHSSGDLTKSSRSSLIVPSRSRMTSFMRRASRPQTARRDRSATRFIVVRSGAEQGQPVGAQRRRVGVDHDVVEEGIDRRLQRRRAGCSERAYSPSRVGQVGARADVGERGGERLLGGLARAAPGRPAPTPRRSSSGCCRRACWRRRAPAPRARPGTRAPRRAAPRCRAAPGAGSSPRRPRARRGAAASCWK